MINLLKKLFEAVTADPDTDPEAAMKKEYGKIINTNLVKSKFPGEKDYLKFWMLSNGDIIPVTWSHLRTASVTIPNELWATGAISGSILNGELDVYGKKKITKAQITQLKQMFIEYDIHTLVDTIKPFNKHSFEVEIKSAKELAYYLEYGKEQWEARGHWRASHEYICPKCSFKVKQKDFKEKEVKDKKW